MQLLPLCWLLIILFCIYDAFMLDFHGVLMFLHLNVQIFIPTTVKLKFDYKISTRTLAKH